MCFISDLFPRKMEKFILCGLDQGKSQIKLQLPIAKHFVLNAVGLAITRLTMLEKLSMASKVLPVQWAWRLSTLATCSTALSFVLAESAGKEFSAVSRCTRRWRHAGNAAGSVPYMLSRCQDCSRLKKRCTQWLQKKLMNICLQSRMLEYQNLVKCAS